MAKLTLADIADLRAYEREREEFRRHVIAEKRKRRVAIGPIVTVVFENALTMRFQIQEMARAERMVSDEAIQGELDAYNPLIPGPGECSLTVFLELTTEAELRRWLPSLVGIERSVGLRLGARDHVVLAAPEPGHASQLTREAVTASVHYVRLVLDPADQTRFATEPAVLFIDHPAYQHEVELREETKASILQDWTDA